jgi:Fe-S-cluster containining protein
LNETSAGPLPAGDFSQWLRDMRDALASRGGMDVACGSCRGCCTSSYFVKVRARETLALSRIGMANLEPGPPGDPGSRLLGFQPNGHCRMLVSRECSIYNDRPETCRSYDCRVFAAAGMDAGPGKTEINERVARWAFTYPTTQDRAEHRAVTAAAAYLRQHPVRFAGGHVPSRPSEIAVLAVKAYTVFLDPLAADTALRAALVGAVEEFERKAGD